jgi:hypothetical protein
MTVLMSSSSISIQDLCRDTIPERLAGYLPEGDRAKAAVERDDPKLAYTGKPGQSQRGERYNSGTNRRAVLPITRRRIAARDGGGGRHSGRVSARHVRRRRRARSILRCGATRTSRLGALAGLLSSPRK